MSIDTSYKQVSEVTSNAPTLDTTFSYANLYAAFQKCCKGVRWKRSVQSYIVNAATRIARLWLALHERRYKPRPQHNFTIMERGKKRNISALTFEDRIVHKCLCDNYLQHELSKRLIYDSGATLKGKGLSFTERRLTCHLQRFFRKHGNNGFVLRVDVHNFFQSIDHEILFSKYRQVIQNDELYHFVCSTVQGDVGLGLGSQVSQISAMYYLNDLDHFIKERLHIKYYGRYMDDMYLISASREELERAIGYIRAEMVKLKLELNEEKTVITPLHEGFVFCKTKYLLKSNGKILRLITTNTFKSMHRKLKKGVDLTCVLPSWRAYLSKFNARKRTRLFAKKEKLKL